MSLDKRLKEVIKEVPDFPKPGISFKDLTPLLLEPALRQEVVEALAERAQAWQPEVVAAVDARGFLLALPLADALGLPFVPIRKAGKLPRPTLEQQYELEYGAARLALHREDIRPGQRILLHDDLLATGGTAAAAAELVRQTGAKPIGMLFLMELDFLSGRKRMGDTPVESLLHYQA